MQTLCPLCSYIFVILARMILAVFCLNTLELSCSQVNGLHDGEITLSLMISVLKRLLMSTKYII